MAATGDDRVRHIPETVPGEAAQIDAIYTVRRWFVTDEELAATLRRYLSGSLSLPVTAGQLAAPIDEAFSTDDYGQELADEVGNRSDTLGDSEALPGLSTPRPCAEGQLWSLYYGILHAARKISWSDNAGQIKLVELVRVLKARTDPPLPPSAISGLRPNWPLSEGRLWSTLALLGPSARESWNDAPVWIGFWYSLPEIHAWQNVNAFVARLSKHRVAEFWTYGEWAFRDGLEKANLSASVAADLRYMEITVSTAAVWLAVAGKDMFERSREVPRGAKPRALTAEEAALDQEGWYVAMSELPGYRMDRWDIWRQKFEATAGLERLDEAFRAYAADAAREMERLEAAGHS